MKKVVIIFFCAILFIAACDNDKYSYYYSKDKSIVVTRIEKYDQVDHIDKVYLAKGMFDKGYFPTNYISVRNEHLLGGFNGLMRINDTEISILDLEGDFESHGKPEIRIIRIYDNGEKLNFYRILKNDSLVKRYAYILVEN